MITRGCSTAGELNESVGGSTAGQCAIKDKIGTKCERIYHGPGGEYFDATRIDTSKGKRWFCTEAVAVAAGFYVTAELIFDPAGRPEGFVI